MSWLFAQVSERKAYLGKDKTSARRLTANISQKPNPFVGHEQRSYLDSATLAAEGADLKRV
jgi:hypothetical protein